MDWTPENFNYVFEKENKVKWGPLVQLIDDVVRLQINLTNSPYRDTSINTVSSDESNEIAVNWLLSNKKEQPMLLFFIYISSLATMNIVIGLLE